MASMVEVLEKMAAEAEEEARRQYKAFLKQQKKFRAAAKWANEAKGRLEAEKKAQGSRK